MVKELQMILKYLDPTSTITAVFLFGMGSACVVYLGDSIRWFLLLQGLFIIIFLLVGDDFLRIYSSRRILSEIENNINEDQPEKKKLIRSGMEQKVFQLAFVFLSLSGLSTFYLLINKGPSVIILIPIIFLLFYVILDRLSQTGRIDQCYVEIINTMITGLVIPLFGYSLQTGSFHQLVLLFSFPVLILSLAGRIIIGIRNFSADQKNNCVSIVQKIGWQNSISLYDVLILLAFASFFSLLLLGIPWTLLWPVLLCSPVGAINIWMLQNIKEGKKPFWSVLVLSSYALSILPVYLISFSLWVG